ncbi:hypothetical protein B0H10DRAFT_2162606 [Mycena sp. CBHHK59/15]|nr:hypothetical protein B0H10DRAFT_2162606 [Mycena sp. CBHHK59/15]
MSLKALFYAYILGGLTFLPLVIAGLVYFTIYTSVPVGDPDARKKLKGELEDDGEKSGDVETLAPADANDVPRTRKSWLTMRRTFEESSLDGGYVTLVRSFLDARSKDPKKSRPKDMWYVALKGKILYLYEDEAMTECEAAIELGSHDVTVYPEGLLDGELFAKRNAICLEPKIPPKDKAMPSVTKAMDLENVDVDAKLAESGVPPRKAEKERESLVEEAKRKEAAREEALDLTMPWFIFVRSNVEMEDWYFALIHASDNPPQTPMLAPLQTIFQPSDMNHLVSTLDEQPDVIPMRWLNALIGRVFFSFYRTHYLEAYIIGRLMKKLSKVKRPTFLTDIVVTEVSPMLKELTKEGDASMEVHLQYKGEVRITVEATATINLGSRFKPYLVKLVLAAVLKEIEGNLLVKIKRPPSNRIWYAFTQTPRMVFEVEPIVSDRQITWGMITSTLESRMKEIIQESVVMPNMDDIAFFESSAYSHRGGIWSDASRREKPPTSVSQSEQIPDEDGSVASAPLPEPPPSRRSWFSSVRSDDVQSLAEQDGYSDEDLIRGRSVEVDKSTNARSRSTPNASDTNIPPESSEESDDSYLRPSGSSSQPSSMRGHGKSNSVEEYLKPSSEPSTSLKNGSSPTASSFLSTLKSRDKQAISNTAKETMRKWGVNWSGLMKDSGNSGGDEMPDHGSFGSRRADTNNSTLPHKARASYAEVRAAVAERRGRERGSDGSPGRGSTPSAPIPIPDAPKRERAVTMQPGRRSQTALGSTASVARTVSAESSSGSKHTSPAMSRANTDAQVPAPDAPPTPSPIHVQPQAKMMTIPGIHASHRGDVMSMGYVAPEPVSPTPESKLKNPAIQSVYRLWKSPTPAEASSAPRPEDTAPVAFPPSTSPSARPTPPPLPPRTVRTPSTSASVSHVARPELGPPRLSETSGASAALQSIANKDRRASVELGFAASPPRRVMLSSGMGGADEDGGGAGSGASSNTPLSNPGPPLPPRKPVE